MLIILCYPQIFPVDFFSHGCIAIKSHKNDIQLQKILFPKLLFRIGNRRKEPSRWANYHAKWAERQKPTLHEAGLGWSTPTCPHVLASCSTDLHFKKLKQTRLDKEREQPCQLICQRAWGDWTHQSPCVPGSVAVHSRRHDSLLVAAASN